MTVVPSKTPAMERRVLLGTAGAIALAGPVSAALAGLDETIHLVFTQQGSARDAALRDLVARGDTGVVAPLIQALFWLRPDDDRIDRALGHLTGASRRGWTE